MSRDAMFRKSSRKALNGVSNLFPAGLRVLVIDDDQTCLENMEKMLKICSYEVTTCTLAVDALSMLQKKKDGFDLVISNAFMPDMDGFMLLKRILLETDLPVIMTSVDDGKDAVMRSVRKGACDYLIKPVHIEAIKNIWQHVLRKKRLESKNLGQILGKVEDHEKQKKQFDDGANWRSSKRREEDVGDDQEYSFAPKKPRVVWSAELHEQFVAAVNKLGNDNGKAVPKKILEVMNVPGLTRENVASHLQKYRLYLKRHQNRVNPPFVGAQEAALSSISSFDELDLQTLSTSGHLPPQILERTITNTSMGMSIFDQRPDSSKTGFGMLPSLQPFENVGLQLGCGFSGYDIVHGHQNNNSLMMQMGQQNEQPWFGNGLSLTSCTPTRGRSNGGHHVFDEVGQSKSRNWELQYVAHAQPINSIQSNGDFSRLSLSEAEHGDQLSSNPLITHKFVEDDFMDGFLNQQEGDEPIECEFNFDGYSMDNILPP